MPTLYCKSATDKVQLVCDMHQPPVLGTNDEQHLHHALCYMHQMLCWLLVCRLPLVEASRAWRQGAHAFVVLESDAADVLPASFKACLSSYF